MQQLRVKSAKLTSVSEKKPILLNAIILPFESANGFIFSVIRILGQQDEARKTIEHIIHEHLKTLQKESHEQTNIPRKFEQTIQDINQDLLDFSEKYINVPISDLHIIIGIRVKNQIFLTGTGNLSAIFMHRTAQQRYSIYELDQQLQEDQNWNKVFVTVLDGGLHQGDVFYAAIKAHQNEITNEELQEILTTLPPLGALKRIHQYIHRDNSFAAICFQVTEKEIESKPKKINPLSSVKELSSTQDQTATLLGEQKAEPWLILSGLVKPLLSKLSSPGKKGPFTILKRVLKAIIQILLKLTEIILIFIKKIWNLRKKVTKNTSKKKQEKNNSKKKLQIKHAYIALGAVAVISLSITGIFIVKSIKKAPSENQEFETLFSRIEEKKHAAEASLIYNDTDQAKTLINDALNLIKTIPPTQDQEIRDRITNLEATLQEVSNTINGVNEVTIIELGNIQNTINNVISITNIDGTIYAISNENQLASYSHLENSWKNEQFTLGSVEPPKFITKEGTDIIIVDQNKNLARANLISKTINPVTSGVSGLESVEDIATYNSNLYVLTNAGNQIVRMRPQATSYDAGTVWITSTLHTLEDLRSIAIDGNIYVLSGSKILKFSSGNQEQFSLSPVEPELNNPTEIWTNEASNYLYILEPSNKRILVFDKNGIFISQYFSEMLTNANSFIVSESNKSITFSTATQIFSFPAEHLLQ